VCVFIIVLLQFSLSVRGASRTGSSCCCAAQCPQRFEFIAELARTCMHITCTHTDTDRALDCNGQIDCIRAEYNCRARRAEMMTNLSINHAWPPPLCSPGARRASYIIIIWPLCEYVVHAALPPVVHSPSVLARRVVIISAAVCLFMEKRLLPFSLRAAPRRCWAGDATRDESFSPDFYQKLLLVYYLKFGASI
jgi:hypothetical protein